MKIKRLLEILKEQNPNDEIVLWKWGKKGSEIYHLSELCKHKKTKGYFEIGINECIPIIYQDEWHTLEKED